MGLYTFLYGNPLYRLYFIRIQPARLVPARLSRYTAHTAYTAIQPYTPYIIQRYTASLWVATVSVCERPRAAQRVAPRARMDAMGRKDVPRPPKMCKSTRWEVMAQVGAAPATEGPTRVLNVSKSTVGT